MQLSGTNFKLADKKYGVIYADPPWYFKNYSKMGRGRNPNQHYKCMSISDIQQLPIADIALDNSVLLIWVTDPLLHRAFQVIDAWGFTYKTVGFTWAKTNKTNLGFFTGLGYWTRSNPEMCLLATKGKPKRISKAVKQLVVSERREHSRKPDEMYTRIEELLSGPYIELFARNTKDGWDSWGNEVNKHDG
jgi:N6-adenosine-specific RNA methylase IME4|tara:strand:- start:2004 stop:2573 length:570 start_codon:yes stop_codon:yes gene_type:complete